MTLQFKNLVFIRKNSLDDLEILQEEIVIEKMIKSLKVLRSNDF